MTAELRPSLVIIARGIGGMLYVPAVLAAICTAIGFLCREPTIGWIFLGCALGFAALASALYLPLEKPDDVTLHASFASAASAWAIFSVAASLPFLLWAWTGGAPVEFSRFDNCLFEGTSAATSTGLTIVSDTAALPGAFQFWRSICQWVGGLGVVVLVLTFFDLDSDGMLLRGARRRREIEDDVKKTVTVVWKVHGSITLLFLVLFGAFGMPWWEALNHALTAVSTGGFTMNGQGGIGVYSPLLQALVMLAMIAGAISYFSHYRAIFKFRPGAWFESPAHWGFYAALAAGAATVMFLADGQPIFELCFLWVSGLTTCGFSLAPPSEAAGSIQLALVGAMFVGGMAGSTAGGIKFSRVLYLFAHLKQVIGVFLERGGTTELDDLEEQMESGFDLKYEARMAIAIAGLWAIVTLLGVFALMFVYKDWGGQPVQCLFEAISALGCVGLSSGITSPELSAMPKLVLCFLMWAGRLEILPVVMLFSLAIPRKDRESSSDVD